MNFVVKKKKNNFIAILRVILSFMVVLDHFYDRKKLAKYTHILYYHIPTFFLLSFYYTHKTFTTFNVSKIKLRFERIVLPYICWNTISFILNNIYHSLLKWECYHTFYDFFKNFLNGHMLIISMWFQNILTLTTLIISIFVLLFKNQYILIFQIFMILSYRFQYSGENYRFFKNYFSPHFRLTYGRFFEALPHSLTGFFLGVFKIPDNLRIYKIKTIFVCLFSLIFASKFNFDKIIKGFKYAGIRLNMAAICIFFIFFYLDEVLKIEKIKILSIFTDFSAGIYFIHNLIGRGFFAKKLLGYKLHSISGCIFIYLTSYILCFILNKLIGNTKLKHLVK